MEMPNTLMTHINQIAGLPVEITYRTGRDFTFSFNAIDKSATRRICEFFSNHAKIEVAEYEEDRETYIYLSI